MKNAREQYKPRKTFPAGLLVDSVCLAVVGSRAAANEPLFSVEDGQ